MNGNSTAQQPTLINSGPTLMEPFDKVRRGYKMVRYGPSMLRVKISAYTAVICLSILAGLGIAWL